MSQQINLLNPDLLTYRDWLDTKMIGILSVVALCVMLAYYGFLKRDVHNLTQQKQLVVSENEKLKQAVEQEIALKATRVPSQKLIDEIQMVDALVGEKRLVLEFLKHSNNIGAAGVSRYMESFAHRNVAGLWLTGFELDDQYIEVSGRATHPELVAQYLGGLGQEPALTGRHFAELEIGQADIGVYLSDKAKASLKKMPALLSFKAKSEGGDKEKKPQSDFNTILQGLKR